MTSASTLARRARAEKNPKKAKALRAQANKARREEREAKAFQSSTIAELSSGKRAKKRKVKKPGKAASKIMSGLAEALEQVRTPGIVVGLDPRHMEHDEAANDASLPETPWYYRNEELATLAKLAKKPEEFRQRFMGLCGAAKNDGRAEQQKASAEAVSEVNKQWAINIVSAFIARVEGAERANGGPLPKYLIVDGMTLARVTDALKQVGYTSEGKSSRPQWRVVGR